MCLDFNFDLESSIVTYLSISVLCTLDANNLGNSGVGVLRMVHKSRCGSRLKFLFNAGFNSTINSASSRFVRALAEGLCVDVFRLNAGNIAAVAYKLNQYRVLLVSFNVDFDIPGIMWVGTLLD